MCGDLKMENPARCKAGFYFPEVTALIESILIHSARIAKVTEELKIYQLWKMLRNRDEVSRWRSAG
jgi:hypothetical protein